MRKQRAIKQGIYTAVAALIAYGAAELALGGIGPGLTLSLAAKNRVTEAFCQAFAAAGGVL